MLISSDIMQNKINMIKKVICFFLIFQSVFSISKVEGINVVEGKDMGDILPFSDVSKEKWYYPYVCDIYKTRLMTGTTTSTFSPSSSFNRGQAATVIWRMAGSPSCSYEQVFTDVPNHKYYSEAITWCYKMGLLTDISDNTFQPWVAISRQDFAVLLNCFVTKCYDIDTKTNQDLSSFPDENLISEYAVSAMKWANSIGMITGDKGYLKPKNNITRGQVAKLILYVLDAVSNNQLKYIQELNIKGAITHVETEGYTYNLGILISVSNLLTQTNLQVNVYDNESVIATSNYETSKDIDIELPIININGIGIHNINVTVIDLYNNIETTVATQMINIEKPIGIIEELTLTPEAIHISGWAYDPYRSGESSQIKVYSNGVLLGEYITDGIREDVNTENSITGEHGFDLSIPVKSAGKKTITVSLLDRFGQEYIMDEKTASVMALIGHRGYKSVAPENTVRSFICAGEAGFYGCETDIWATLDGDFICIHNENTYAMTNVSLASDQLTVSQAKALKIKNGNNYRKYKNDPLATTIPTVSEYLEVCRDYNMVPVIEIKNGSYTNTAELTMNQIQVLYKKIMDYYGEDKPVTFISFDLNNCIHIRNYLDSIGRINGITIEFLTSNLEPINFDTLKEYNIGLSVKYTAVNNSIVKECIDLGLPFGIWTVDDPSNISIYQEYGVETITSNVKLF